MQLAVSQREAERPLVRWVVAGGVVKSSLNCKYYCVLGPMIDDSCWTKLAVFSVRCVWCAAAAGTGRDLVAHSVSGV